MLGGDQERYVGRFQGALEQFDESAVLQLEIGLECGFADGAGGIDGG